MPGSFISIIDAFAIFSLITQSLHFISLFLSFHLAHSNMWSQRLAALAALPFISATTSPKRGLCHVPSDKYPTDDNIWTTTGSDLTWYYNYQSTPSVAYSSSNMQFVPMLWGSTLPSPDFKTTVENMLDAGMNVSYVLGFNEPDGPQSTGGSNMPADQAASIWKEQIEPLKARGVKLGAPVVTGSPTGFTWLENWLNACDGGCNPDFIPVHWYGNFEGLASHVGQVMGTYPNMTIWVTEWGFPNQKLEDTQANYNMTTEWFDRIRYVCRYSYSSSL
jgi:hypothetical protein